MIRTVTRPKKLASQAIMTENRNCEVGDRIDPTPESSGCKRGVPFAPATKIKNTAAV